MEFSSMDKRLTIAELSAKRSALRSGLDALLTEVRTANRALNDEESARFDADEAQIREHDAEIKRLDEQIRADEQHAETMRRYAPTVQVTSEPEIYRRGHNGPSYFKDMFNARQKGDR